MELVSINVTYINKVFGNTMEYMAFSQSTYSLVFICVYDH